MVKKLEGVDRVLETHSSNLRSAVKGFKDLTENRQALATDSQMLDARTSLLHFAQIRTEAGEETAALAGYYRKGNKLPSDHDLRFGRVCLANYLLDTIGQMAEKSVEIGKSSVISLFLCARDAIRKLLDDFYFFKSKDQIYSDYTSAQVIIMSCAEVLSLDIPNIEKSLKEYGEKLAARINEINGVK